MYCLRRSRFLRSTGRKVAKSLLARASTQTGIASADERDISARSSDGTLRAFSQSRRATRTRLASSESYSCCCSNSARPSRSRPTSSDVNFSCAIRPIVASCSARAGAPRGGIIVCWSHASTAPALPRSEISCSRVTSSSKSAFVTAETYTRQAAGRRGSSEDDLPLRLNHAPDLWRRTGSESAAGRAWTRRPMSMACGTGRALVHSQVVRLEAVRTLADRAQPRVRRGPRDRRTTLAGELRERQARVPDAQLRDLLEPRRQGRHVELADRVQLRVRGARGSREIRSVGVREAVGAGSRGRDDRVLVEPQRRFAPARRREDVGDRVARLGVRERVGAAFEDGELDLFSGRDLGDEPRTLEPARAQLEVGRARAGQRSAAEERAAEVGAAAAGASDDALRRPLERRPGPRHDSCLAQHLARAAVEPDVELVSRRPVERAARIGADLGAHAEVAKEREGATR